MGAILAGSYRSTRCFSRPRTSNERLLHAFTEGGVTFAVIGGVAAPLHGASQMTVDLDVAPDEENLSRLRASLAPFAPRHATRPELSVLDEPMERLVRPWWYR